MFWRCITIIAVGGLIGACEPGAGLRPLYGSLSYGAGVQDKLASVNVSAIPGRTGQMLRNELIFETARGGARTSAPTYQLDVALKESLGNSLILSTGQSAAGSVSVSAVFQLIRLDDRKTLLSTSSTVNARIDRTDNVFSNVSSIQHAQGTAAKALARDIMARISAVLSTN